MIVADTNLAVHLLLESPETGKARAVYGKDSKWTAPVLWRSEFRNVLTLYLRQGRLDRAKALVVMEEAEALLGDAGIPVDSARVLDLAAASGCTAYDCEFVALAEELGVPLVTSDRDVLKAFPAVAVSLAAFAV